MKNNSTKQNVDWFVVEIISKTSERSNLLVQILQKLKIALNLHFGQLDDDIEGVILNAGGFWELLEENQGLLTISECEKFLSKVSLEWGNILLFERIPYNWDVSLSQDTFDKVRATTITLRIADSGYILIYMRNDSLFEAIQAMAPNAVLLKGSLEDLWFYE